ncbi:unnamed protein product [Schistosoma curassoni]|uniref:Secreted protein n=1 Tax=Schistosoma curassoni TaxID=6186 RepID=A0A183KAF4_9TREM|nr:unnamed protein product [Schistosoma curassoni]
MISGQWMLSILSRQLFINTCTFLMMVVVVLQVSAPYSRTALTFVLKILTLILVESCFEFHMFFNCRNAILAMLILAFKSASELPCVFFGLPLLRFPSGFQVRVCLVMWFDYLPNVCPIYFCRLFLTSSSAGSWFLLSQIRLLLMISGQWMLSILRRQPFINTCIYSIMIEVVLQVSAPYSRTALTFVEQ